MKSLFRNIITGILFLIVFFTCVRLLELYAPKNKGPFEEFKALHDKSLRTIIESGYQNHAEIKVKIQGDRKYYSIALRDSVTYLSGKRISQDAEFPWEYFNDGDSIIKKANNDTIRIVNDSSVFYFLLPRSS